jgi:hypothetical protein
LEPIFDRTGKTAAWFDGEEGDIFDLAGRPIGFVDGGSYYSYLFGLYVGEFDAGIFWDRHGCAVTFLEGATGGPLLPIPSIPPIPPIPAIPPIRPLTPIPPVAPLQTFSWSDAVFTKLFE